MGSSSRAGVLTRRRRSAALLAAALVAAALWTAPGRAALAQSGRRRERPAPAQPQPQPQPQPGHPAQPAPEPEPPAAPPTPIPPGGLVAQQTNGAPVTRYVLRNGLTIVVRENPAEQLAAVRLVVRGEADAAAARAALVAPRPDGTVAARVRALGGQVEIEALPDATAFAAVVPSASAEAALDAEADLFAAAAAGQPAPYRSDAALLVVAGNVIPYNVLSTVQRAYGVYGAPPEQSTPAAVAAPPAPPAPPASQAPAPSGLRYSSVRGDSGLAVVTVSYDVPAGRANDAAAIELAASALADGLASRLGRALRQTGLAARVSSRYEWRGESGTLSLELRTDPRQLDAAEAAFFREVDRFRRERVSDGELQRARNVFERRFLARRATVEGEARELARFEAQFGEVRASALYLERVRAATAADVQRAAATYLSASRASVAELLPPDAPARTFTPATFAETVATWAPTSSREVAASDVRAAEGPAVVPEGRDRHRQGEREDATVLPVPLAVRDFSTLNGPKAFVREDQSRSLISIGFFYPAGRAAEAATERGVTELMLRSMLRGSRRYPGERLALAIEQLGGEVRLVNEPDFFGVVIEALSRNAEQLFPVAIDLVEHPAFEKADVVRERDLLLADQRLARADADARATELFWQSRYPTHGYGAPALGLPETVTKLTDESVRAWFDRSVRTTFPLVGIVGDTDGSSLISRFVAEGFERGEGTVPPTPGLPAPAPPAEAVEMRERAETVQADGFPTAGGGGAALDALSVAVAAAGARAAADLDERQGIARRVGAWVERRRLASAALVTASSAPADEARVREVVFAGFAEVAAAPLAAADLDAARAAAIASGLEERESFSDMLVEYIGAAAAGAPLDTVESYADRIRGVPADAVRKAAAAFVPQLSGRGVVRGK